MSRTLGSLKSYKPGLVVRHNLLKDLDAHNGGSEVVNDLGRDVGSRKNSLQITTFGKARRGACFCQKQPEHFADPKRKPRVSPEKKRNGPGAPSPELVVSYLRWFKKG